MKNALSRAGVLALFLVVLAICQAACGGGGYSSPTAPNTALGQPTPTPDPGRGY